MSIKRMSAVWDQSQQKGSALLLLLAIADYADDNGVAWPSYNTLATKIRMDRRHVIRLGQDCQETGELWILPRTRTSNIYIVTVGLGPDELAAAISKALAMGVRPPRGSDNLSPPPQVLVVTSCHHPSDNLSPGSDTHATTLVTTCHPGVTPMSPDPSLTINEPPKKQDVPLDIWQTALQELQLQMAKSTFDTWLRGTTAVRDKGVLIVQAHRAGAVGWLQNRLHPTIAATVQRIAGEELDVQYQPAEATPCT